MFRKQLFYLSSEGLCVYQWRRGRLTAGPCFANQRAGQDAFGAYLAGGGGGLPAYLMTDLIEEDFQRLTLPHVGGRAGRALVARRLGQQYRDTPFRHASVQGREADGRRDDQLLFCALTNPSELQPWLARMEQHKTALAGIYSTALASGALVRRLALGHEHLLLVTQQAGGLRQSYFHAGQLKFSRLTPASHGELRPARLIAETEKTRQFLTSTHLQERGEVLHTVTLWPSGQLAPLAAQCADGPELAYHWIGLDAAAAGLGLDAAPPLAEPLLLSLLARRPPASHYPAGAARRYYQLWRNRSALHAGSLALLAAGALWTGANLWRTYAAERDIAALRLEAGQLDRRYRSIMATLPPSVAPARDMKAAVRIGQLVSAQAPTPAPMLAMLSRALDRSPQISLAQLDWQAAPAAGAAGATQMPAPGAADDAPLSSLLLGLPLAPPQTLRVEALVQGAPDDGRAMLDTANRFAQELARERKLVVEIAQMPLDVRPSMTLSGKAGSSADTDRGKAKLVLFLRWQP